MRTLEMAAQGQVEELNRLFKNATPKQIIEKALELSDQVILTTNFRPYAAAILHAVVKGSPEIPVIWCDTGYNTPQTYKHASLLTENLALNLFTYVPKQTSAQRDVVMGIPTIDDPNHELFTEQVKLEPFRRALAFHKPEVWFTNLRSGQTAFRDSIDIFSLSRDGVIKVSPFYYWPDTDLDQYLVENELPNELQYFDPTKALENRECGLHN